MAGPLFFDQVRELSSTTGTGPITPSGAYSADYVTIGSVLTNGDTAYFKAKDNTGLWQVFLGTWNGTSVARTTGISGTNGTSDVSFVGPVEISIVAPAVVLQGLVNATGGVEFVTSGLRGTLKREVKTSSYTIVAADRGKMIEYAGSTEATITLPSASSVGANWSCILKNSATGTTAAAKKLSISGTLDGVSNPATYPGDTRIIQSDGTNLTSILLKGGSLTLLASDSTFSLVQPTGANWHEWHVWGGGGGGGSGRRGAASNTRGAGSGGGGGAHNRIKLSDAEVTSWPITCTIAAAAAGGAAVTTNDTNGNNGTAGNNTTVGSILTGYGGGGGAGGNIIPISAGSGGGVGGAGSSGGSNPAAGGGSVSNGAGHFTGAGSGVGQAGTVSGYGGASGGGSTTGSTSFAGGCSAYGGSGGGGGGGITSGNVAAAGAAGGSQTGANGGGGAGGSAGTGDAGGSGTAGPSILGPGTAGGGGGSGDTAGTIAGGAGGDGGIACGGGGGGASTNGADSGAGGQGGPGLIRYWYGP